MFATPNGTRNSLFWPTGTETNFTLNTFTPDLEPYKSKLTFLKGIKLNPSLQNGALGGTLGSEHARGTGGMLTARPLKSGTQFKSFGNTTSGWGSGQSLDQYLADQAGAAHDVQEPAARRARARHRGARAHLVRGRRSADPAARGSEGRVRGAVRHADRHAGDDRSGAGAAVGAAQERVRPDQRRDRRASRAWSARTIEIKLDAHLTAMRDVEKRLVGMTGTGTMPRRPARARSRRCSQTSTSRTTISTCRPARLQMDLAVAALACDQTRILTFQWSYSESEHLFAFLNISGNHHVISHDFASSGANYDAYNKIQIWYQQQFAYLLRKMDAYQGRRSGRCSTTASCCGRPRSASRPSTI